MNKSDRKYLFKLIADWQMQIIDDNFNGTRKKSEIAFAKLNLFLDGFHKTAEDCGNETIPAYVDYSKMLRKIT